MEKNLGLTIEQLEERVEFTALTATQLATAQAAGIDPSTVNAGATETIKCGISVPI